MPSPLMPRLLRPGRPAHLVLSDGTVFTGRAAGATGSAEGEVVFNTSMTGYQEMLTDPSYHGQILTLTTAHVGQVGVNPFDAESARVWARGLIVQDLELEPSSWRSQEETDRWLAESRMVVGWAFDTRAIVRHVRSHGAVPGVLSTDGSSVADLIERARLAPATDGRDLAREVSCDSPYDWSEPKWPAPDEEPRQSTPGSPRVAVVDFGVKQSILRQLVAQGLAVRVLPPDASPDEILEGNQGVVLSNGPGDPAAVGGARELVQNLLGKAPLLGICLGHQLLGLALGGRTIKLPFGHHGGNHPVRELGSSLVLITSQNHNYAVDEASLPREVEVTHINLTDGTVEGLALPRLAVEAVQFHPEASPGPSDAAGVFERFARRCRGEEPVPAEIDPEGPCPS